MWRSGIAQIGRSLCARSANNCSSILSYHSGGQLCSRLRILQTAPVASVSNNGGSLTRLFLPSPATRLVQQQVARNELTIKRDYRTQANSRNIHASRRISDEDKKAKNETNGKNEEKKKKDSEISDEEPKGLWKRFKWMFRRYWYLAVPVHAITSTIWLGSFFMIAKSGLDVIGWLEYIQVIPESWLNKIKSTPTGANIAVAYLLYKMTTPVRYFVTVYGTHMAIKILRRTGHLRTSKEMGVSLHKRYAKRRDQATHFRAAMMTRWEKQKAKRGVVKPRPPHKSE